MCTPDVISASESLENMDKLLVGFQGELLTCQVDEISPLDALFPQQPHAFQFLPIIKDFIEHFPIEITSWLSNIITINMGIFSLSFNEYIILMTVKMKIETSLQLFSDAGLLR